jgi:hypothetical protein
MAKNQKPEHQTATPAVNSVVNPMELLKLAAVSKEVAAQRKAGADDRKADAEAKKAEAERLKAEKAAADALAEQQRLATEEQARVAREAWGAENSPKLEKLSLAVVDPTIDGISFRDWAYQLNKAIGSDDDAFVVALANSVIQQSLVSFQNMQHNARAAYFELASEGVELGATPARLVQVLRACVFADVFMDRKVVTVNAINAEAADRYCRKQAVEYGILGIEALEIRIAGAAEAVTNDSILRALKTRKQNESATEKRKNTVNPMRRKPNGNLYFEGNVWDIRTLSKEELADCNRSFQSLTERMKALKEAGNDAAVKRFIVFGTGVHKTTVTPARLLSMAGASFGPANTNPEHKCKPVLVTRQLNAVKAWLDENKI